MFVQEYRASKILFNFLRSNKFKGRFLLPANVCGIVPLTFYSAGIDFEFVDIQNDNLCIDQQEVLKRTNTCGGLLFVRTFGLVHDFDEFFRKIKKQNPKFVIIDDCCLCMPDFNSTVSDEIDLKLFSLGYAKQVDLKIGAFGYVGTNCMYKNIRVDKYNPEHYDIYENELRNTINSNKVLENKDFYFLDNEYYEMNSELIAATIERSKNHKQKLNYIYANELPESIQMNSDFQNWRFNILLENNQKVKILNDLFSNKLFASSHYYPLSYPWKNQTAPNALSLYNRILNLFNDFYYTEKQAVETCMIINNIID